MPRVFGHDKDTAMRLRNKSRTVIGSPSTGGAVLLPKASGGGLAFYRLMEDVTGDGLFWAKRTTVNNTTPAESAAWTQVRNWDGLISGAIAASRYLFAFVDSEWVVVQGQCVTGCPNAADFDMGDPPEGQVNVEYSHSITISGVSSVAASGLPAGLSYSAGSITGTPTEDGVFFATLTGTATRIPSGPCNLTRVLRIVVQPEE